MKSFSTLLEESKRVFEFKIRVANFEDIDASIDRVETMLMAFDLADVTKVKTLPVQAYPMLFPQMGPVEVSEFSATLNYPCTADQIKSLVCLALRCDATQVFVMSKSMADMDLEPKVNDGKTTVLTTDVPNSKVDAESLHGEKGISSFLKTLTSKDVEYAATTKTPKAKTTNTDPMGTTSPISGSKGKK